MGLGDNLLVTYKRCRLREMVMFNKNQAEESKRWFRGKMRQIVCNSGAKANSGWAMFNALDRCDKPSNGFVYGGCIRPSMVISVCQVLQVVLANKPMLRKSA